jgi:hypothetical protein
MIAGEPLNARIVLFNRLNSGGISGLAVGDAILRPGLRGRVAYPPATVQLRRAVSVVSVLIHPHTPRLCPCACLVFVGLARVDHIEATSKSMKTHFYERTAYQLSSEPVPPCFLSLDEHFDTALAYDQNLYAHRAVLLAESVCSRMADVEMYAFLLADTRKRNTLERKEDEKAAILTRSFFLGFITAVRALLDSAAVTLATLYELPIARGERSFANGDFWHQLVLTAPAVHRRYHPLRLFFNEALRWQSETVTRVPPLVVLQGQYGHLPGREAQLKVADDAAWELWQMAAEPHRVNWIDPLELYTRWKPRLLALCEKICQDIQEST